MTALEVVDRKWYVNLTEREKTDGKKQRPKIWYASPVACSSKKVFSLVELPKLIAEFVEKSSVAKMLNGNFQFLPLGIVTLKEYVIAVSKVSRNS
jgi:hypothetical protein